MFADQNFNRKEKNMSDLERKKMELIKLRIKNKYYDRQEILERVVSEIIKNEMKKN